MEIYNSFQGAMQLALWINSKNFTGIQQELLMKRGIKNKEIYGEYCLLLSDFEKFDINLPL